MWLYNKKLARTTEKWYQKVRLKYVSRHSEDVILGHISMVMDALKMYFTDINPFVPKASENGFLMVSGGRERVYWEQRS